jgi:RNA recognition motif-containing protein
VQPSGASRLVPRPFRLVADGSANVHLPKDRISQAHQGFGFCEFMTEEDADYACQIMNQIKMWGKPIRVNKVRRQCVVERD